MCPFVPFLAILGAVYSDSDNEEDKTLLRHVINSLEAAAKQSPGAAKLCQICRILHQTAMKSIGGPCRAKVSQTGAAPDQSHLSKNLPMENLNYGQHMTRNTSHSLEHQTSNEPFSASNDMHAFAPNANAESTFSMSDNAQELFGWFDDYLGCNASMMDILETDQTQLDWNLANL